MYNEKFHTRRIGKPYYPAMARACLSISRPKSVLDIGCSCGSLLANFPKDLFKTGLDFGTASDTFMDEDAHYIEHDLTRGWCNTGKRFDLINCQEVIEHLPQNYEDNVMYTIHWNAKPTATLVFSGAHVGQRGKGHVNCQPASYWTYKFIQLGWRFSLIKTNRYVKSCGEILPACYSDNTMVFVRGNINE